MPGGVSCAGVIIVNKVSAFILKREREESAYTYTHTHTHLYR